MAHAMQDTLTQSGLWVGWRDTASRPDIDTAIRDLYQRVDAAIADRGPTCWQSGKCCKFDAYGHRLYVTGLEIGWFLGNLRSTICDVRSPEDKDPSSHRVELPQIADRTSSIEDSPGACPFQHNNLCTTHTIRPLGCRVFFCQEGTQDGQNRLYEDFLGELRRLHEAHAIEYRYMEWRTGLREAQAALGGRG